MTQEDKDLLLKDLCARLAYGVFCEGITTSLNFDTDEYYDHKVKDVLTNIHHCKCDYVCLGLMNECELETVKPYLFPMSSMTEEQAKIFLKLESMCILSSTDKLEPKIEFFEWLNSNHFDYRGLIGKGLAIDATKLNIY